jgi:hypothetical protein
LPEERKALFVPPLFKQRSALGQSPEYFIAWEAMLAGECDEGVGPVSRRGAFPAIPMQPGSGDQTE